MYTKSAIASTPSSLNSLVVTRWVQSVHERTIGTTRFVLCFVQDSSTHPFSSGRLRTNGKDRPATRSPSRMCPLLEAMRMQTRRKYVRLGIECYQTYGTNYVSMLIGCSTPRFIHLHGLDPRRQRFWQVLVGFALTSLPAPVNIEFPQASNLRIVSMSGSSPALTPA